MGFDPAPDPLSIGDPAKFAAGIENVGRYLHAHNEAASVTFAVEGDRAYVRHELADLSIEVPRQHNECSLVVGLNSDSSVKQLKGSALLLSPLFFLG